MKNTIELIRTVSQRSFPNEQLATYGSQPVSESEWIVLIVRAIYKPNKRQEDRLAIMVPQCAIMQV